MILHHLGRADRSGERGLIGPRSVSRTMATAVIMIIVIDRMMARRPGTMLVDVWPSGLNSRWTATEKGGGAPAAWVSGR